MTSAGPPREPAATPRRRLSAQRRREQLLDLARDIVAAEGFAAVSIERIARAAQVARALVYQQFTDLSGLLSALLDRESAIAAAGVGSIGGFTDPEQIGAGILRYLQAAPISWRIMLSPPEGGPPGLRVRLEAGRRMARTIGAHHLSQATGTTVDPDGPTVRIALAAIEELARLHLADPARFPEGEFLRYTDSQLRWAVLMETPSTT